MRHGCGTDDVQDHGGGDDDDRPESNASPASKPVAAHAFEVADYSLGPLDFAVPAVNEVVPLKVENYSLGPIAFSVPAWRWGEQVIHWHDAGCDPAGRPSDIPADKAPGLIAATRSFLIKRQITDLKRMPQADRTALYDFVRELVKDESIQTSDRILREQIIGPALQRDVTKTSLCDGN
jgi:hypothetical protein